MIRHDANQIAAERLAARVGSFMFSYAPARTFMITEGMVTAAFRRALDDHLIEPSHDTSDDLPVMLAALDDRELVLGLALVPVDTLINRERCHVHDFAQRVARMEHLRPDQQDAMKAIFDWHNLRTTGLPDEGYFRCLAVYGAAATHIVASGDQHAPTDASP